LKIVSTIKGLENLKAEATGFVPTMGAFHEGHLKLMRVARKENERVVVSLFVNPTQFGKGEDFTRYPRDLDRDAALAEKEGVDILFTPSLNEIYPRECSTILVPEVTDLWEGAIRPTHFAGVATVVCKLLNIVRCDVAYFGQKDLQQCIVIKRLIEDLNIPVRFSRQPTVREPDGLALSSRNMYLSPQERSLAPLLYAQLTHCKISIQQGDVTEYHVAEELGRASESLSKSGFRVDYFELIDLETTRPIRAISDQSALIVAARLGNTRLIDNLLM